MKTKLKKYICGYNNENGYVQLVAHRDNTFMARMVVIRNGYKVRNITDMDNYRILDTDISFTDFIGGQPLFF